MQIASMNSGDNKTTATGIMLKSLSQQQQKKQIQQRQKKTLSKKTAPHSHMNVDSKTSANVPSDGNNIGGIIANPPNANPSGSSNGVGHDNGQGDDSDSVNNLRNSGGDESNTGVNGNFKRKGREASNNANGSFVQVLLQNNQVGKVIGRRGVIVEKLKSRSGAYISISDYSRTMPRIANIRGPQDKLVAAIRMIAIALGAPPLTPEEEKGEAAAPTETKDADLSIVDPDVDLQVTLLVPQHQVGTIIGRGGSRINGIRQSTGATIQVSSDQGDRVGNTVRIHGNDKQFTEALTLVAQSLCYSRKHRNNGPNPSNTHTPQTYQNPSFQKSNIETPNDDDTPTNNSSNVDNATDIPKEHHDTPNIQQSSQTSKSPTSAISALQFGSGIFPFQSLLQGGSASSLFSSSLPFAGTPLPVRIAGTPVTSASIHANARAVISQQSRQGGIHCKNGASTVSFIKVIVANAKTGILIGRKGSTIQRIKAQSGAIISVSDFVKGSEDRTVTIRSPNVESIQKALALLLCTLDGQATTSELRLNVVPTSLGSVIGRKGSRVQSIRQTTGASVHIEKDGLIKITGQRLNVWAAGSIIVEHLYQHQQRILSSSQSSQHTGGEIVDRKSSHVNALPHASGAPPSSAPIPGVSATQPQPPQSTSVHSSSQPKTQAPPPNDDDEVPRTAPLNHVNPPATSSEEDRWALY